MKTIGFIGVGVMGRPMVKNLLTSGLASHTAKYRQSSKQLFLRYKLLPIIGFSFIVSYSLPAMPFLQFCEFFMKSSHGTIFYDIIL